MDTLLVLSVMGVPAYSARGLTQTLKPIAQAAAMARTVNGALIDLSPAQFQKYASSITCADQRAPALDGVWPGKIVSVDCVAELCYLTNSEGPSRPVVNGDTTEPASREEGDFTFYRPVLQMMVTGFNTSTDEYGAVVSWTLELEEV